ncbi:MAG: HlyD family efflux transporter periplasmic adaptor subunit [Anaerolineae bacterium]
MNLKFFTITLAIVLLVSGTAACASGSVTSSPDPTATPSVQAAKVVVAEGIVVPTQYTDLSFQAGGRVVAIEVEEGETVTAGQLLAQLDDSTYQASVEEAEAGLSQAQANLNNVLAPPTPAQIDQAQAVLDGAEAALAQIVAGPTEQDIAIAKAQVAQAQAQLNKVLAGTRDEDLQAASAQMLQAEADVRIAQANYDKNVYGNPQVAEHYGIALEKATLAYDAVKAQYDKLVNGATSQDIAIARAGVQVAEASLDKLLAGATPDQIAQGMANVANARAALARLRAGATDEQIAIAQAAVGAAQKQVKLAQVQLAQTRLVAPFDGTVGAREVHVGQTVAPGTPAFSLGNTSRWQIETDNLTQIDIIHVYEGADVTIKVDALPDEKFSGRVVRITPKSQTKAGDVTYQLLIDTLNGDTSRLRWGMTSFVYIQAGPES